jgi:cyclopropane fatty-acyl-phospholipid synthase-like methyltransferase
MDLDRPFDLTDVSSNGDQSGTPTALIEHVRRLGDLVVLDRVSRDEVLIEYPLAPTWRRRLEAERFVQLREPRDGRHYALIRNGSSEPPKRRPKARRQRSKAGDHLTQPLSPYPADDPVGGRLGLAGAGIFAYQTGDQMHPPMINDAAMWSDVTRWQEGARDHVRAAARLLGVQPGHRVLDIGCGIGGPARLLVDEFDVRVHGISTAELMLETTNRLNRRHPDHAKQIEVSYHDCQDPYDLGDFDAAWSMNMLYHVSDKEAMLRHAFDALRPHGRMMVEDWMLTDSATVDDVRAMASHFQSVSYAKVTEFEEVIRASGLAIVAREDLGDVGRTLMARHFTEQFNAFVRPRLEADFPDSPLSGAQMADEWIAGIETTIDLYTARKLTYLRLIVARPS